MRTIKIITVFPHLLIRIIKEKVVLTDGPLCKLSHLQVAVLVTILELEKDQSNKVSSISDRLELTLSSVSKVIRVLEQKQLVERIHDDSDRRIVFVNVRSDKKREVQKLRDEISSQENSLLRDFSSQEQDVIRKFVRKMKEM